MLEAQRQKQRTGTILMLREDGATCTNGVGFSPSYGWPESTHPLLTSSQEDFLDIMIDESHDMGQIKGMYNGDRSRKEMLSQLWHRCRRQRITSHCVGRFPDCHNNADTGGDYEMEQADTVIEQSFVRQVYSIQVILSRDRQCNSMNNKCIN